jgi:glycosyltransferase involved in cell wall biosynthesis
MRSLPVVRVVPYQPHCFAFGGFEVQMLSAMESARAAGVDIAPLDFWRREPDFDVAHLWGLDLQHHSTVRWASAGNKKIVLSALVSYPGWNTWLRHKVSLAMGPARLRKHMLAEISCITVVNFEQARYLVSTVGFPAEKVTVVPNIVDDIFFAVGSGTEAVTFGLENYVLCVGNICRRKNQLALVNACRKLGVPLLLVGNILTGEELYGHAVEEAIAAGQDFRWIQRLEPGSEAVAGAYRSAAVFALPSYLEQQPISAL